VKKRQFVKFYDKYAPRIYRFVYFKVNSIQDSEDITSEAFFKFWQNLAKLAEKKEKIAHPQALLYKIANNLVIDFYRKKPRTELILDPEDDNLAKIRDKTDINKEISLDSDIDQVKKALNQLKDEHQNIVIWRYLDDFSVKEMAQIIGKPEGTIRVLIHRALKELKKKL
jgi:RNA polymerase sigma-70 factor (ECF subfamily)|tara:strand:+ start:166 stop:672 length:507 start_codon:yes stop_codon:yes gene_type:complete